MATKIFLGDLRDADPDVRFLRLHTAVVSTRTRRKTDSHSNSGHRDGNLSMLHGFDVLRPDMDLSHCRPLVNFSKTHAGNTPSKILPDRPHRWHWLWIPRDIKRPLLTQP